MNEQRLAVRSTQQRFHMVANASLAEDNKLFRIPAIAVYLNFLLIVSEPILLISKTVTGWAFCFTYFGLRLFENVNQRRSITSSRRRKK